MSIKLIEIGYDTYTDQYAPDNQPGASQYVIIRRYNGLIRNGLLWFDLSSLVGKTIISANLILRQGGLEATGSWPAYVYRIYPANNGWTEGASWNYANPTTQRWAGDVGNNGGSDAGCYISGVDYHGAAMGTFNVTNGSGTGTLFNISLDLTEFGNMISGNYGLVIIKGNTIGTTYAIELASKQYADPAYRPYLSIDGDFGRSLGPSVQVI